MTDSKPHGLSRRSLLKGAGAVGVTAATGLLGKTVYAQTSDLKKVTMVRPSAKSFLWGPEDYGMATGIFAKHGIEVEVLGSNRGVNITGVVSGDIDIGIGDPSETFNVRAQGQDIKIFGSMHHGYTVHLLVKGEILAAAGIDENSPLEERIALMKGLRFGHPGVGSGPEMLLRYHASLGGLDPETDIELVSITGAGPGMLAGIEQGAIDGFAWGPPWANVGIKKFGLGYLAQMQRNPPELFKTMKTGALQSSAKSLVDKRDLLVAYLAAYAESQRSVWENPDKYKEWLIAWLELDADVFDAMWSDNSTMLGRDPWVSPDIYPPFFEFLNVANATRGLPPIEVLPYEEFVDGSITADAKAAI